MKHLPWWTWSIACAALAVQSDGPLAGWATLDRQATMAGQWWRLITGHLAHWSADHQLWDLLGWLIVGSLAEYRRPPSFRLAIIIGAPALSIALLFLQPDLQLYRGLSGLLAIGLGLWAAGWWRSGDPFSRSLAISLTVIFLGKVLVEQLTGACLLATASAVPPVPLAHLLGFGLGLGAGLAVPVQRWQRDLTAPVRPPHPPVRVRTSRPAAAPPPGSRRETCRGC